MKNREFVRDLQVLRSIGLEKRAMEQAETIRKYEMEDTHRVILENHWRQLRWFITGIQVLIGAVLISFGLPTSAGPFLGIAAGMHLHPIWLRLQRKR